MTRNPKILGGKPVIGDVIGLTGMTLRETAEYLTAKGIRISEAGVKAWTRGAYNPPAEVIETLWELFLAMLEPLSDESLPKMPEGVPESVLRRDEAIAGMADWYRQRHPNPTL